MCLPWLHELSCLHSSKWVPERQDFRHNGLSLVSSKGEKEREVEKHSKCKLSRERKALILILSFTG